MRNWFYFDSIFASLTKLFLHSSKADADVFCYWNFPTEILGEFFQVERELQYKKILDGLVLYGVSN